MTKRDELGRPESHFYQTGKFWSGMEGRNCQARPGPGQPRATIGGSTTAQSPEYSTHWDSHLQVKSCVRFQRLPFGKTNFNGKKLPFIK